MEYTEKFNTSIITFKCILNIKGKRFSGNREKKDWLFNLQECTFLVGGTTLVAQIVKNLLQCRRPVFSPWVGKIPWRGAWQPTPVFMPGEFHGQRSLVGYGP